MTSSAGNTRGLIEATTRPRSRPGRSPSSAGNTRGLIEAQRRGIGMTRPMRVFRGEYPRPH